MEDATITQEPLIKERFPSVVDTDDLIFELGKKDIKVLNLEKLLNGLIKKSEIINQAAADLSKSKKETTEKIVSLEESNKLYEDNNRQLSDELIRVRKEIEDLQVMYTKDTSELRSENTRLEEIHKKQLQELISKSKKRKKKASDG